jgi:excisionase family DNA binding protein
MRGLGDFQRAQMKHRDQRVFLLCQHLRAAIDVFEEIASAPYREERPAKVAPPPPRAPLPPRELPAEKLAYTIKEAALALGLGKTTLYAAMKAGAFKVVKLGNRTLIPSDGLRAWFESLPTRERASS